MKSSFAIVARAGYGAGERGAVGSRRAVDPVAVYDCEGEVLLMGCCGGGGDEFGEKDTPFGIPGDFSRLCFYFLGALPG